MSRYVVRPEFYETQVLAARDLGAIVDHARGRQERHASHLHRPGVVAGLDLETEDAKDANGQTYKRVFVRPGLAIDAQGRELLLDERLELDAVRFATQLGTSANAESFYPVFARSQYIEQRPDVRPGGRCGGGEAVDRIEERVEVFVGRAGDETTLATPVAEPSSEPSPGRGAGAPLLLGFVRWDPDLRQFKGKAKRANGVSPPHVGVQASTLAGLDNRLLLQLTPEPTPGDLAFEIDGEDGSLRYGPLQPSGQVGDALMGVDTEGNLTVKGTLKGRSAPGVVHVESGYASDGLILPLPAGVTEEQIAQGHAHVHVTATPHIDPDDAPGDGIWTAAVEECRVDASRRLHCRIAWMKLGGSGEFVTGPGAADFQVIAAAGGEP